MSRRHAGQVLVPVGADPIFAERCTHAPMCVSRAEHQATLVSDVEEVDE